MPARAEITLAKIRPQREGMYTDCPFPTSLGTVYCQQTEGIMTEKPAPAQARTGKSLDFSLCCDQNLMQNKENHSYML